ncbi:MAG: flavodoxin family protein [Clostridia bacterium]|nr:flavodoxin family protein [Clostridia bacterium]MDH7572032.1 flavodoxin family protein [Clostridia bacterium]
MKVVGIAGSTRREGNTRRVVEEALAVCRREGLETHLIDLADKQIEDCRVCLYCRRHPGQCAQEDDLGAIYRELKTADAFILASPVYFSSVTGRVKALVDRVGWLSGSEGRVFERKVGGALVVGRRAGHIFAFSELNNFFLHQGMIVPGSSYWNVAFGREPGEVGADAEGLATVRNFASNLAWLVKKLAQ